MIIINPTTGKDVKDNRFNSFVDKVVQYLYDHHKSDFCKLIKLVSSNLAIDYGAARMISAFYNTAAGAHKPHPRPYSFPGITGDFFLCKDWQEKLRPSDNRDFYHLKDMITKKFPLYDIIKVGKEFQLVDTSSMSTAPITYTPTTANGNIILYGPPGTGKTYNTIFKTLDILGVPAVDDSGTPTTSKAEWFDNIDASRDKALEIFKKLKADKRIIFTTFHQSMSYEDFIEGIKPVLDGTSIGYKIQPGIFKEISEAAQKDFQNKYVLIIDEINRGNVANIFGELITLIEEDKRIGNKEGMTCTLPYSKEKFGVPNNLFIIGTMNTADRSVEALDTALRRRFTFEEMMPKPELLSADVEGVDLQKFLDTINKRICLLKDREHQIGHSYFMNVDSKDALIDVIFKNVIPLLQEYFYGDYEKIQMVLGDKFIHREKFIHSEKPRTEFAIKDGNFDNPEYIYSIVKPEEITADIDAALESINFGFSKPAGEGPAEVTGDAE